MRRLLLRALGRAVPVLLVTAAVTFQIGRAHV